MIKSVFQEGLKVTVPFLFTLFLLYWLFVAVEKFLRWMILLFVDQSVYFPGMGWIFILVFIFFAGLIMKIKIVQQLKTRVQGWMLKLPLINTFYDTATDLTSLFTKKEMQGSGVVLLETPMGKVIGIVTQEDFARLPDGIGDKEEIAVYVQMSYNLGGYTFVVNKSCVTPLDISVRQAVTLCLTACVSGKKHSNEN